MRETKRHVVDEVQTAEAIVTFYEKRLDEARARLASVSARKKKAAHRGGW